MSVPQVGVSGECDCYAPGHGGQPLPCTAAATVRTVTDAVGEPVQVALCSKHFAYVAAPEHAHYWFVDRTTTRTRALIRLTGRND